MLAASVALSFPVSVSWGASTPPAGVDSPVVSSRVWTDTGVTLRPGDLVEIRATGLIHFGGPPIDRIAPRGIPWDRCTQIEPGATGWPAPGIACWSLIGRIGSEPPFAIGDATALRVPRGGQLWLGVNDNHLADNSGAWSATVRVTPQAAEPGSNDGSSSTPTIAIAAAAAVVLVALLVLVARRRRAAAPRAAATGDAPPELPAMVPLGAARTDSSADILPQPRNHGGSGAAAAPPQSGAAAAPPVSNSIDVNIFEVEFPDLTSLRVGYNHFPEGTVVRWRVRQAARMAATGQFVASGGGSTNHLATISLGTVLEPNADGADVDFTWTIGGVPFGYSVRRDPGG